jgi:hypothetical protein
VKSKYGLNEIKEAFVHVHNLTTSLFAQKLVQVHDSFKKQTKNF